jgi:hypothetical protein
VITVHGSLQRAREPTHLRSSPLRLDPQASPGSASRLPLHLAQLTARHYLYTRLAPRRQDLLAATYETPSTVDYRIRRAESMRKVKETYWEGWEGRRRRLGLTILSMNMMSLRLMESAVAYSLCVDNACELPYIPINNRHLYHESLNWPSYDPLPQ